MSDVRPAQGFLDATFEVGRLSLLRLVAGLVRAKFAAVVLGAAGVGLLAQGNQLFILGVTVGSLSMSAGIIRRVSLDRHEQQEAEVEGVLAVAFTSQLIAGLLASVILLALSEPMRTFVFGQDGKTVYILAVALAIPLGVLASGYVESVLFAYGRYDLYTKASIATTLIGLFVFMGLVVTAGVTGALWAVMIGAGLLFVWFSVYARRLPIRHLFPLSLRLRNARGAKELWAYSAITGLTASLGMGVLLAIRAYLIRKLGADANGLYQVPIALTAYYTPFLTNALWARTLPAASAVEDSTQAIDEGDAALRILVVMSAVAVIGILSFGEVIVGIVYSSEFLGAIPVMSIQLAGDVLYFAFFAVSMLALARRRFGFYFFGWLFFYVVHGALAVLFIRLWGLSGAGFAYLSASILVGIAALVAYRAWAGTRRSSFTIRLTVACSIAVAVQAAVVATQITYLLRLPVLLGAGVAGWIMIRRTYIG